MTVSNKLTEAFKALRRQGYITRKSFSCCRGCAGSQLADELAEKEPTERASIQGAVFFTKQDAEVLSPGGRFARRRERRIFHPELSQDHEPAFKLFISYGPIEVDDETVGKPVKEIGEDLVAALKGVGLQVEWDGNPDTRVAVVVS